MSLRGPSDARPEPTSSADRSRCSPTRRSVCRGANPAAGARAHVPSGCRTEVRAGGRAEGPTDHERPRIAYSRRSFRLRVSRWPLAGAAGVGLFLRPLGTHHKGSLGSIWVPARRPRRVGATRRSRPPGFSTRKMNHAHQLTRRDPLAGRSRARRAGRVRSWPVCRRACPKGSRRPPPGSCRRTRWPTSATGHSASTSMCPIAGSAVVLSLIHI